MPVDATARPEGWSYLLRRLSHRAELLMVLGLTVLPMSILSGLKLLRRQGAPTISMGNAELGRTLTFELFIGFIVLLLLRARGWRLRDVTAAFTPWDVPRGMGLWLAVVVLYVGTWLLLHSLAPTFGTETARIRFSGSVAWPLAVAVTVLNPLFEEFLFLGYIFRALREDSLVGACLASVLFRAAVHTYQGPLAFSMIPLGTIFAWVYLRRKSLWPVVIAHAMQDGLALAWLVRTGGAA